MHEYYDKEGNSISEAVWVILHSTSRYKILKHLRLDNDYWVSTVWLGMDHRWVDEGPPLIFETMVFYPPSKGGNESQMQRYSSEEEALLGHEKWLKNIKILKFYEEERDRKAQEDDRNGNYA